MTYAVFTLGETSQPVNVSDSADHRTFAVSMVQQARRSLEIMTRELDKAVYDDPLFVDAVRALTINARHKAVRILLKDSTRAVKYGHRLIPLSQRLTSFIEIRKLSEQYREYNEAFLVADAVGFIHRKLADRHEGVAHFNASHEARRLVSVFDEMWRASSPDSDLRRLYL